MSDTPPNWYPDPTARHQHRYWDGTAWTDNVSDNGVQGSDPVQATIADSIDRGLTIGRDLTPDDVSTMVRGQDRYRGAGITGDIPQGNGTIWGEPILVVSQKAKLIEVTNQCSVLDQHGNQIAFVNEIGQSAAKKAIRVLTSLDQFLTHRVEICDRSGQVQLRLTRPGKVFKSTVVVEHPNGGEIGRIVQQNVFGKIRFDLQAGGQTIGAINAENWRAWNFHIADASGTEVARITKTWEGMAKTLFTTADNYVVHIHTQVPQPLLSMVVAAALTIDTALKQDSRGLG
jgi:uncharacterized protein YxjI